MSIRRTIPAFNLEQTAGSGQCFRWQMIDKNTCVIHAMGRILTITLDRELKDIHGGEFTLDCSEDEWNNVWSAYIDMDTDYESIGELIMTGDDQYLKESYGYGSGIRILRQDLWEVIISFLISQNNNISRIKGSIEALCHRAGLKDKAFPNPADLNSDFDFSGLGLGYRDDYLRQMYEYGREESQWLKLLPGMEYEAARKDLLSHRGIGPKVADCICLFGLHHVEAFPIDTHVKQILAAHYPEGFDFNRYAGVAGICQQYMFYNKLNHK